MKPTALLAASLALLPLAITRADTFGSGANTFTIDFVNVGNPGNGKDEGAGGGLYSSPYGGVPYVYRMGTYEIPLDAITKATAGGLLNVTAGPFGPTQPAANMSWYEAAAFVNWLNTSTGHQAAYNLDVGATALTLWASADAWQAGGENLYRHKDAYYFLPSEDEWYKAAYHKNDGVTANYWDYATASNSIPTAVGSGTAAGTAVYNTVANVPAAVNRSGGLSAYGTMGQGGNVWEWMESASDGINDSPSENRTLRGDDWSGPETVLRCSSHLSVTLSGSGINVGFRVASIPEPASAVLLTAAAFPLLLLRRRQTGRNCAAQDGRCGGERG